MAFHNNRAKWVIAREKHGGSSCCNKAWERLNKKQQPWFAPENNDSKYWCACTLDESSVSSLCAANLVLWTLIRASA